MLATMHTSVRREIFVSVLLLSVLGSSVSEEQKQSCPKICPNLAPVQLDAWWMVYVRDCFEWKVARNISDQVVEGRVPPDKWTADSREAEGVEVAEEGRAEERRDGINEGEYCGHYWLC
jgi:hypothetical protein